MKRESLITKLVAFMLCVMMVVGCLPVSAFAANDWEGDIDIVETEPPAGSSAANPIEFEFGYRVDTYGFFYTESQSGETFYKTYGRNGEWTFEVSGEGSFSVNYNGETFAAVDGVVSIPVAFTPFANELSFSITGEGEFSLSVAAYIPEGSMNNPAVAALGDNPAAIEAGNTQGYFWTYTAEKAGDLVFTFSSSDNNWTYTINNMTTGAYGDAQWNDSDPVVNPATVTVAEGDEIQIIVNTYNPADMWGNPAGTVTFNLAYAPEGPEVDANLKFAGTPSLSFQDYIGINLMALQPTGYDKIYIEAVQVAPDGASTTETIEGTRYASTNYFIFDKAVVAWSMSETVTITLYGVKGEVVYQGQVITTSVEELALGMIEKYATSKPLNCQVLVDMLNYGAEVQIGFNHFADSLPNTNLGEYASFATAETPAMSATNSSTGSGSIKFYGTAISMQDKVLLQLMIKDSDLENYEVRYTVDGVTDALEADDFVSVGSGYSVACIAVKASQLRSEHTVAWYDPATDEVVSVVWTLTVEAFAKNNLGGDLNDVAVSLMKYGDSVVEYAAG